MSVVGARHSKCLSRLFTIDIDNLSVIAGQKYSPSYAGKRDNGELIDIKFHGGHS